MKLILIATDNAADLQTVLHACSEDQRRTAGVEYLLEQTELDLPAEELAQRLVKAIKGIQGMLKP